MTSRSHTETFFLLRNNAVKQRSFTKYDSAEEDGDSEEVRLVRRGAGGSVCLESEDSPVYTPPDWLSLVESFRYEASTIGDKIEGLRDDQQSYLKNKTSALFDQDERSLQTLEQEIENKSHEITRRFNRLHDLVLQLKAIAARSPGHKVLRNIQQYECRELADLSERLRSYQRDHLSRLTEKEKYMEQFVINFDDVDDDPAPSLTHQQIRFPDDEALTHSDSRIGFENRNYQSQEQLEVDYVDNELLRQQDAEMTKVMRSIVELNQIFQDMSAMVVNQGSLMDRIDYNMETVHMKVREGAIQLAQAERSAARTRKLKCILILFGSCFLALLIWILQS